MYRGHRLVKQQWCVVVQARVESSGSAVHLYNSIFYTPASTSTYVDTIVCVHT